MWVFACHVAISYSIQFNSTKTGQPQSEDNRLPDFPAGLADLGDDLLPLQAPGRGHAGTGRDRWTHGTTYTCIVLGWTAPLASLPHPNPPLFIPLPREPVWPSGNALGW